MVSRDGQPQWVGGVGALSTAGCEHERTALQLQHAAQTGGGLCGTYSFHATLCHFLVAPAFCMPFVAAWTRAHAGPGVPLENQSELCARSKEITA